MAAPLITPSPAVRRARGAVFALFFTNGALFANIIPRYPEIKDTFALSDFWYGATIALFPLGAICSGPFAARLIRRITSARTATLGTVGIGVSLTMVGAITVWRASMGGAAGTAGGGSPWSQGAAAVVAYVLFGVVYFAGGAFDSVTDVGQNAHGLRVQRSYGRSIISSFHGGWSLGAVTGGLMGVAATQAGLPLGWHLMAAAILFIVVGAVAYRFTLPGSDDGRPEGGVDAAAVHADAVGATEVRSGGAAGPAETGVGTLRLSPVLVVALLTVMALAGGLIEDAASTWSTLYMRDELGVVGGMAGLAYVTLLASQTAGRLSADRVVDALGPRNTLLIGGALITASTGVAVLWPSVASTLVGMVLAGVGCASIVPLAMNAADDIPGLPAGSGLTVVTWLMRLSFLLSPPLVGLVVQATSLRAAMAVIPIAGLLTLATAWVLAPRARSVGRAPDLGPGARL
ncbi:MAG: MFS transporter [Actinomyces sp.]|jgi:MFS family permease|nr:MFS transporter [Actinomyces sp.]MCI1641663.1 MFS transporter [Actinomyces sp.]MCI1661864.1 MFS transporter [Actinomyces sp.]MCI1690706.1 MFS transporter [Actinomyces sp.]MCI1786692.1 MFS transporter [Actinomyces sp.]MCI1829164.1 MFS transporter [Actinomyces sp.]